MKNYFKDISNGRRQWTMKLLVLLLCVSSFQLHAEERPILEMTLYSSKLLKPDLTPNFSIYADGSIEIYKPIYMKNSGLYAGQLNDQQLNNLMNMINSMEHFDSIEAEENYYQADLENSRLTNQLYYSSETMVTILKLNNPSNLNSGEVLIVAENVQEKSTRFNNLADWKNIADAENMLKEFESTLTLRRIADAK